MKSLLSLGFFALLSLFLLNSLNVYAFPSDEEMKRFGERLMDVRHELPELVEQTIEILFVVMDHIDPSPLDDLVAYSDISPEDQDGMLKQVAEFLAVSRHLRNLKALKTTDEPAFFGVWREVERFLLETAISTNPMVTAESMENDIENVSLRRIYELIYEMFEDADIEEYFTADPAEVSDIEDTNSEADFILREQLMSEISDELSKTRLEEEAVMEILSKSRTFRSTQRTTSTELLYQLEEDLIKKFGQQERISRVGFTRLFAMWQRQQQRTAQ